MYAAISMALLVFLSSCSMCLGGDRADLQTRRFQGGTGLWDRVHQEKRPTGIDWAVGLLLFKSEWVIATGGRRTVSFSWRSGAKSEFSSPASYGVLAADGDYLWVGSNISVGPTDPGYTGDRLYKHKWPRGAWDGYGHPGGACANIFQLCADGADKLWALFDGPLIMTLSNDNTWKQAFPPAGEHLVSPCPHIALVWPNELWIAARRAQGEFPKTNLLRPGMTILNTKNHAIKRRLSEKHCAACYDPLATYQDTRGAIWVLGMGPAIGPLEPGLGGTSHALFASVSKDGKWLDYRLGSVGKASLGSQFGNAITEDKKGNIWVYHAGLYRFDASKKIWTRFGEPAPRWDGFRNEMLATPDGRIWLTDRHGSIWTFKGK